MREAAIRRFKRGVVLAMAVMCSCDSVTDPTETGRVPLNPKLKRVMYWGDTGDAANEVLNDGFPVPRPIRNPVWTSTDRFYVSTFRVSGGEVVRGIYEVGIDAATFDVKAWKCYEFPHDIWKLSRDGGNNSLLGIYDDVGRPVASRFTLVGDGMEEQVLVTPEWYPTGITWSARGVVFYGRNPSDQVSGFYLLSDSQPELMLPVTLSLWEAHGISTSVDGQWLFYARGNERSVFHRCDLLRDVLEPEVIADRTGAGGGVACSPTNASLLLLRYYFPGDAHYPPQGHLELFDMATSLGVDLDVRTEPRIGLHISNEGGEWSPTGEHFLFSASAAGVDAGRVFPTIWVYRNALEP